MPTRFTLFLSTLSLLVTALIAPYSHADDFAQTKDASGAHDSPYISRFQGAVLAGYQMSDYDQLALPLGQYDHKREVLSKTGQVEGKITRLFYFAPKGKSMLEVFRNYERAFAASATKIRFECISQNYSDGCGYDFVYTIAGTARDVLEPGSAQSVMYESVIGGAQQPHREITARLNKADGTQVDFIVVMGETLDHSRVGILVETCESKAMAKNEVAINAKAMSDGLSQSGHIALYGIHFASDSAKLTADSADTLAQMAKLLKSEPRLKVYIVGHTDDSGALAHNLDLSQARADAVVQALESRYGIAAQRLASKGVASYAPVASNASAAGRAKNRRVALVQQ